MAILNEKNDFSEQPLMGQQGGDEDDTRNDSIDNDEFNLRAHHENRPSWWSRYSHVIFHVLLILLYTSVSAFVINKFLKSDCVGPHSIYSPASGVIKYEQRPVDGLHTDSIFVGEPSPELEDAWHDLLRNINLRVTADEMGALGQTSLELTEGRGYLGTLGVYHELHCIKRLRKWFYKDHYYPNMTTHDYLEHSSHAEHCLELLRQASICKGDTSITAFKWLKTGRTSSPLSPDGYVREPTTKEGVLHQCVNWESLSGWASQRRVDLFDPGLLVQPTRAELEREKERSE